MLAKILGGIIAIILIGVGGASYLYVKEPEILEDWGLIHIPEEKIENPQVQWIVPTSNDSPLSLLRDDLWLAAAVDMHSFIPAMEFVDSIIAKYFLTSSDPAQAEKRKAFKAFYDKYHETLLALAQKGKQLVVASAAKTSSVAGFPVPRSQVLIQFEALEAVNLIRNLIEKNTTPTAGDKISIQKKDKDHYLFQYRDEKKDIPLARVSFENLQIRILVMSEDSSDFEVKSPTDKKLVETDSFKKLQAQLTDRSSHFFIYQDQSKLDGFVKEVLAWAAEQKKKESADKVQQDPASLDTPYHQFNRLMMSINWDKPWQSDICMELPLTNEVEKATFSAYEKAKVFKVANTLFAKQNDDRTYLSFVVSTDYLKIFLATFEAVRKAESAQVNSNPAAGAVMESGYQIFHQFLDFLEKGNVSRLTLRLSESATSFVDAALFFEGKRLDRNDFLQAFIDFVELVSHKPKGSLKASARSGHGNGLSMPILPIAGIYAGSLSRSVFAVMSTEPALNQASEQLATASTYLARHYPGFEKQVSDAAIFLNTPKIFSKVKPFAAQKLPSIDDWSNFFEKAWLAGMRHDVKTPDLVCGHGVLLSSP